MLFYWCIRFFVVYQIISYLDYSPREGLPHWLIFYLEFGEFHLQWSSFYMWRFFFATYKKAGTKSPTRSFSRRVTPKVRLMFSNYKLQPSKKSIIILQLLSILLIIQNIEPIFSILIILNVNYKIKLVLYVLILNYYLLLSV